MQPCVKTHGCFSFDQRLKNRQAFLDHFGFDTVADPEITGTAEAVAGHHQQVVLLCFLRKGCGIAAGSWAASMVNAHLRFRLMICLMGK